MMKFCALAQRRCFNSRSVSSPGSVHLWLYKHSILAQIHSKIQCCRAQTLAWSCSKTYFTKLFLFGLYSFQGHWTRRSNRLFAQPIRCHLKKRQRAHLACCFVPSGSVRTTNTKTHIHAHFQANEPLFEIAQLGNRKHPEAFRHASRQLGWKIYAAVKYL